MTRIFSLFTYVVITVSNVLFFVLLVKNKISYIFSCAGWNDSELGAQSRLADDGGSAGCANTQEGLPPAPVLSRRF